MGRPRKISEDVLMDDLDRMLEQSKKLVFKQFTLALAANPAICKGGPNDAATVIRMAEKMLIEYEAAAAKIAGNLGVC